MSGEIDESEKKFDSEIALAFNKGDIRLFKNVVGNLWGGKLLGFDKGVARIVGAIRIKCGIGGIGGSDRIGLKQIIITPEMCGKKIAVFTAIELKTVKGIVSSEQQNFINFINNFGGVAGVARSIEDVKIILANFEKNLQA